LQKNGAPGGKQELAEQINHLQHKLAFELEAKG
jgi:hypothetical protein